jgi:quercetin dioxygenase-like cupin family protein
MLANMGKEQGFDPTIKIAQCRKWIQEVVQEQEEKRHCSIFPEAITNLPQADIPMEGVHAFLAQGAECQIIFMEFDKDVALQEHAHASQYGIVLEGKIELTIGEERKVYQKGERYYIPDGVRHFGKIYAGYADMTFFDQQDRYRILKIKNTMH